MSKSQMTPQNAFVQTDISNSDRTKNIDPIRPLKIIPNVWAVRHLSNPTHMWDTYGTVKVRMDVSGTSDRPCPSPHIPTHSGTYPRFLIRSAHCTIQSPPLRSTKMSSPDDVD